MLENAHSKEDVPTKPTERRTNYFVEYFVFLKI